MSLAGMNLNQALTKLQAILPSLSESDLAKAQQAISQLRELRETEAIRFFQPNSAQQEYINAVGEPGGYIVIFSAGNGVGKTAATCALIAAIIWPELAPKDVFQSWVYQNWLYPKHFRIISTPQEIGEGGSVQTELKKWFPRGQYEAVKNGKPYYSQYLAKGFTINLMSFDMAPEAFEGATCGLVIFNEPPPKPIFNACGARMRRGGRILFPGTPLMDAAWMLDNLVSKADGKHIKLVGGDIEQNCRDHSPAGLLAHSDIERMLLNYDPDELEARRSGKFMHLSGRILKGFDRNVHVVEREAPVDVCRVNVCDPAIAKPLALLWAWADATGSIHIYDEHPEFEFHNARDSNLTVPEYANQIILPHEEGKRIDRRILDRHFGTVRRTMGGKTLKEEFLDAGLEFEDSYVMAPDVEVETGILKIKDYLRYDKTKPVDSLNRPRLTVSPRCVNTIAAIERSSRDPKTGKQVDDGYKDFFDNVRMLVMSEPRWEAPSTWTPGTGPVYA